jgi:hypothetical protein
MRRSAGWKNSRLTLNREYLHWFAIGGLMSLRKMKELRSSPEAEGQKKRALCARCLTKEDAKSLA